MVPSMHSQAGLQHLHTLVLPVAAARALRLSFMPVSSSPHTGNATSSQDSQASNCMPVAFAALTLCHSLQSSSERLC